MRWEKFQRKLYEKLFQWNSIEIQLKLKLNWNYKYKSDYYGILKYHLNNKTIVIDELLVNFNWWIIC